jgi:hypothetical protein
MTVGIHDGIKLPPAIQALRDEIRALDRYLRGGRLNQPECEARLDEWGVTYPPGMSRYHKLALLGVWEDGTVAEIVVCNREAQDEGVSGQNGPKPWRRSPEAYRTPQSTIDAFFGWVVRLDEAHQQRWLAEHPKDAPYLLTLWREKCKLPSK